MTQLLSVLEGQASAVRMLRQNEGGQAMTTHPLDGTALASGRLSVGGSAGGHAARRHGDAAV